MNQEGAGTGIASLFRLSEETQRLCALAMRIIAIGYVFAGANIALQGLLQAFGHGVHSLIISLLRLIIIALPCVWALSLLPQAETLVWLAFPIAESLSCGVAFILLRHSNRIVFGVQEASEVTEAASQIMHL